METLAELLEHYYEVEVYNHCKDHIEEEGPWSRELAREKFLLQLEMDLDYFKTDIRATTKEMETMDDASVLALYYYCAGYHEALIANDLP